MQEESSADTDVNGLVDRASCGDEQALDALLERYRPYLRLLAERELRPLFQSRFDASDVVQQTCYAAFRGIGELKAGSTEEFNGWITRILQNYLTDSIRRHTAEKRDVRREEELHIEDGEVSIDWGPAQKTRSGPESQVVKGEAALFLAGALVNLDWDRRIAVQLRYFESYTLAQIAEYLGTSPSTVVRLIDSGLEALRDALPTGVFDSE